MASSRVGRKGKSVAAAAPTPPAWLRPLLGGGSGGHWSPPYGLHARTARGGGAGIYLRSPSFHFSAPLLLLIIFHLPLGPLASRQVVAEPMQRRLRSIYTPSPSPGLTLPPRQLSRRRGPAPRPATCTRLVANQGPRSCSRASALRTVRPRGAAQRSSAPAASSPIGECPLPPLRAGPMSGARRLRRPRRLVGLKRPVNLAAGVLRFALVRLRAPVPWRFGS